jgi:lysophospholipase L1-like esterase
MNRMLPIATIATMTIATALSAAQADPSYGTNAIPDFYSRAYAQDLLAGEIMLNETVLFLGEDDAAPLIFKADRILSVRSYGLDVAYEEGRDWILDKQKNLLRRAPGSRMPFFTEAEFYPDEPAPGVQTFGCTLPGRKKVLFGERDTFTSRQIAVTYQHGDKWKGPAAHDESKAFAPLLARLKKGQPATVVYYGDSITTRCNSSGMVGVPPFAPGWPEMVHARLRASTGNDKIGYVNTAKGGMGSQWGIDNVQSLVVDRRPDLVLLAFGMNDMGYTPAVYAAKTAEMIDKIRLGGDAAILLVPPMIPNAEVDWVYRHQPEFEGVLKELVAKYRGQGATIGYANVTSVHAAVLARKRFRDMTGNNVNHCNDFSARIYSSVILRALLGAE